MSYIINLSAGSALLQQFGSGSEADHACGRLTCLPLALAGKYQDFSKLLIFFKIFFLPQIWNLFLRHFSGFCFQFLSFFFNFFMSLLNSQYVNEQCPSFQHPLANGVGLGVKYFFIRNTLSEYAKLLYKIILNSSKKFAQLFLVVEPARLLRTCPPLAGLPNYGAGCGDGFNSLFFFS